MLIFTLYNTTDLDQIELTEIADTVNKSLEMLRVCKLICENYLRNR